MMKYGLFMGLMFLAFSAEAQPKEVFPTPSALGDAVAFWKTIFTLHESSEVVAHDRERMDIVWEVIELPKGRNGKTDEWVAPRAMTRSGEDLKARLERLERTHLAIDEEDERLLLVAAMYGKSILTNASERVRLQRGVADHFALGLDNAEMWLPQMRVILKNQAVPLELAALPFIESSFNTKAKSSVGAAGIWQLMPRTAKGLGLRVSRAYDERLDVLKATKAAARMLKDNHRMLGSWPLAITAYNHGPNGVRRAVAQVGSTDLMELIEKYDKRSWGFASKNFYAEFLAALEIVSKHHPEAFEAKQNRRASVD